MIVEATCMWAPARSMWRNEASSPVSRSSLTARSSHTCGQAPRGLQLACRAICTISGRGAQCDAAHRGPRLRAPTVPRSIERAHLPSPAASAGGAGDPPAAPPERAARGESGGDPSVAAAGTEPATASPSANPVGGTRKRVEPTMRRYLLPAMLAVAAVLPMARHGRRRSSRHEHRTPKRVDADLALHVSTHNVLAGQRPGRQRPGEPEPGGAPPGEGRRRRSLAAAS